MIKKKKLMCSLGHGAGALLALGLRPVLYITRTYFSQVKTQNDIEKMGAHMFQLQ